MSTIDREDFVLVMTKAGRIAGQVVDATTRAPIPRFGVRLVAPETRPGERDAGGRGSYTATYGRRFEVADGIWHIDDERLETGGVAAVEISADGYATGTLPRVVVVAAAPDPLANILALVPGCRVGIPAP